MNKGPRSRPGKHKAKADGLRVIVLDDGGGVCLYVRFFGADRLLVDCRPPECVSVKPLSFLRELGELGPLTPLSRHLRPGREGFEPQTWLGILRLVRGLVLRPGGSWVFWQPAECAEGFSFTARVVPRALVPQEPSCGLDGFHQPPLLVLGLPADDLLEKDAFAGRSLPPAALVANSSLAMKISRPGGDHLLVGGDLRPGAWRRLLGEDSLARLLGGCTCYLAGAPSRGFALGRGLKMAALPWLVLGALVRDEDWPDLRPGQRTGLATPGVGALIIDVDQQGVLQVRALPWLDNCLVYRGLARPLADELLPAPWPLRRALAQAEVRAQA